MLLRTTWLITSGFFGPLSFLVISDHRPVSRKPRKAIFQLSEVYTVGLKLSIRGTFSHIKNIIELNSSVVIRFEVFLWLSGRRNFSGPSRNGLRTILVSGNDLKVGIHPILSEILRDLRKG